MDEEQGNSMNFNLLLSILFALSLIGGYFYFYGVGKGAPTLFGETEYHISKAFEIVNQ